MKAIRVHEFGGPEVLHLEDVPDLHPASGQVVMAVRAIGVNPLHRLVCAGLVVRPPLPFTPGDDAAGVIAAVGEGVKNVKVGDRVYGGQPSQELTPSKFFMMPLKSTPCPITRRFLRELVCADPTLPLTTLYLVKDAVRLVKPCSCMEPAVGLALRPCKWQEQQAFK